ncbi:ABC transporter ATP-binding protein [Alphaproteobacteria bacterium]|nr:ABC transporter ATP-binding protein [Alphaproteobacteria bacterium]
MTITPRKKTSKNADATPLLQALGIVKKFGDFTANDDVSFSIYKGEIHALLGENGAGKSTFVKMIYGLMQPDAGLIEYKGAPVVINGPQHARDLGIGMVFQHFSLFQALTVAENIQLALPPGESLASLSDRVRKMSAEYGIGVDPEARVHNLSVGQQQRVEIMRCLLQDPSLLIMDEPTSVLTPQETEQLFDVLRRFSKAGMAILFISHKLDEIRALTSRATVLRRGVNVGTVDTSTQSSRQLAEMMVGEKVGDVSRGASLGGGKTLLTIKGLARPRETQFATALQDISMQARSGEILGIAGIAGNGQDELMEALIGEWRSDQAGVIMLDGHDISRERPAARRNAGLGFVPEERNGHAAVPVMTLAENNLLTGHSHPGAVRNGVIDGAAMRKAAGDVAAAFDVRLPNENPLASSLSGGNLQKFVVGREIVKSPLVLIVSQPTWGVDIGAAMFIRSSMLELAAKGSAVVMISQDLEEVFMIAHRIAVLYDGRLSEAMPTADLTAEKVGLLMGGSNANTASQAASG